MSLESFRQFHQMALDDLALLDELRKPLDTQTFILRVVEAGKTRGFDFCADDVTSALREARRSWIERWLHQ